MSFHTRVTLRASWYAPPDTGVSDLQLVALERLPSIEGAAEILMDITFSRGLCRGGALLHPKSFRLLSCLSHRGKSPEKPKGSFWSVQGSLRGNRNPLRLFFFCQRFLLEKQKKMLYRTCKFSAVHRPLCSFPETPEASPMRGRLFRQKAPPVREGLGFAYANGFSVGYGRDFGWL